MSTPPRGQAERGISGDSDAPIVRSSVPAQDITTAVLADDGVTLATDVWLPGPFGRWPTILIRTPYGRDQHPDEAASITALGFAFVVQDTRGRFDSGGEDTVFRDDGADGRATLRWITRQPWSDGDVCTFGGSALGITQYLLAARITRLANVSQMHYDLRHDDNES